MGYPHVILAIGQLVEQLTVDCAEIRWPLPGSIPGGRTAPHWVGHSSMPACADGLA